MRKISAEEVKKLPEGTKVFVCKEGVEGRLEYELIGKRPRYVEQKDLEGTE